MMVKLKSKEYIIQEMIKSYGKEQRKQHKL